MVNIKIVAYLSSEDLCQRLRSEWRKYVEKMPPGQGGEFRYELEATADYGFVFDKELDAEAIIARGSTANDLRSYYPDIPVAEVPYTTVDILNTIQECQRRFPDERIGIIGTDNVLVYFDRLRTFTPIRFEFYKIGALAEVDRTIRQVKEDGLGVIVGGPKLCRYAALHGLEAVELSSTNESLRFAMTQAIQSARGNMRLKQRLLHYQGTMDRINEGIISLDSANRISMFNNYASELLGVDGEKAIGKLYETVITSPHLKHLGQTKREIKDELILENDLRLNANKINISIRGSRVGQIIHIQNITKIQQLEEQIRKKTHSSGLVAKYRFEDIKGESPAIRAVVEMAQTYAAADSNVLIEGRTGFGKKK